MAEIRRLPERALADRSELNLILDSARVATLSTVEGGLPLVVPLLFARDGDRLLLHGSTGAGALRLAATGAPIALSVGGSFTVIVNVFAPLVFTPPFAVPPSSRNRTVTFAAPYLFAAGV